MFDIPVKQIVFLVRVIVADDPYVQWSTAARTSRRFPCRKNIALYTFPMKRMVARKGQSMEGGISVHLVQTDRTRRHLCWSRLKSVYANRGIKRVCKKVYESMIMSYGVIRSGGCPRPQSLPFMLRRQSQHKTPNPAPSPVFDSYHTYTRTESLCFPIVSHLLTDSPHRLPYVSIRNALLQQSLQPLPSISSGIARPVRLFFGAPYFHRYDSPRTHPIHRQECPDAHLGRSDAAIGW